MQNKKLISLKKKIIIIGAGPAGLAAASELNKKKLKSTIFEKSNVVGGLARTVKLGNNLFDIGPHRFFTKNNEINKFFINYAGKDLIKVKRLTRILYQNKLFNYPLSPINTFFTLGIYNGITIFFSYLLSLLFFKKKISSFEDWVIKNFGKKLYYTFFKTYTEKVWGISCKQIGSDWASQRIKGLNFASIILSFFFKKNKAKSLIDEFYYLKFGAGNLYENIKKKLLQKKNKIIFNQKVIKYNFDNKTFNIKSIIIENKQLKKKEIFGDFFLSSAPITEVIKSFNIKLPDNIKKIIYSLKYRNHIGVKLVINGKIFEDNWIYVHSPEVKVARISNYKNFSKYMGENKESNPITMEYFCNENDKFWNLSDQTIISIAKKELEFLELAKKNQITDSYVIRSEKAYPVIEKGYQKKIDEIKKWLSQIKNFIPIGRTGMFKYNNQDHAILTGLIGARKICDDNSLDPWLVNIDAEYHEEKS
jgi:protoporphyrinogen oxidase